MNSKFWLAVLAATIIGFFGGWLLWGILLEGYMEANTTEGALALYRAEDEMIWWAMIVGQVAWALLITWVISATGSTSAKKGAVTAVILMGLTALAIDMFFYAMMDMFTGVGAILVDVVTNIVMAVIVGAVVGWILGSGQSQASPV